MDRLIDITGITCPPEADAGFNRWYEEEYLPGIMKSGRLSGITRYRLVRSYDEAAAAEYPAYLTIYAFKDRPAFADWTASPQHNAAEEELGRWTRRGVRVLWRTQYQLIKGWQQTQPLSVITVVGTWCPADTEKRFDAWYSRQHVPDLLKFKGMAGATRYRLAADTPHPPEAGTGKYPRFLTFYHFKDVATAAAYDTSPERLACREDWLNTARATLTQLPWRAQYQPLKTWQSQ